MLIEFSEVQLAGGQEHDGADGGEARIAAGDTLGGAPPFPMRFRLPGRSGAVPHSESVSPRSLA